MTLREAIVTASARLAALPQLAANANRDAETLLLHVLQAPRTLLFVDPHRELSSAEAAAYEHAVERRLRFEPIQYITGEQEFYGLPFHVTPAVLIPRPETELLVEAVLARVTATAQIVDVGAGSGAIAVALAKHLPEAALTAVDISEAALAIAKENAARNGVQMRFLQSDLLGAIPAEERFDAIVANPPYVPESDRATLHPEVSEYEPALALFAGEGGLDIYRRLIPEAAVRLKPGGLLAMEIGFGQREAVARLLEGWDAVEFLDDFAGISRVALTLKPWFG